MRPRRWRPPYRPETSAIWARRGPPQRITGELKVFRSGRSPFAQIQMKVLWLKRSEVKVRHRCDVFPQSPDVLPLNTRQSYVRRVGALFPFTSDCSQSLINFTRE